jgi:hypothetical protein
MKAFMGAFRVQWKREVAVDAQIGGQPLRIELLGHVVLDYALARGYGVA